MTGRPGGPGAGRFDRGQRHDSERRKGEIDGPGSATTRHGRARLEDDAAASPSPVAKANFTRRRTPADPNEPRGDVEECSTVHVLGPRPAARPGDPPIWFVRGRAPGCGPPTRMAWRTSVVLPRLALVLRLRQSPSAACPNLPSHAAARHDGRAVPGLLGPGHRQRPAVPFPGPRERPVDVTLLLQAEDENWSARSSGRSSLEEGGPVHAETGGLRGRRDPLRRLRAGPRPSPSGKPAWQTWFPDDFLRDGEPPGSLVERPGLRRQGRARLGAAA